MPTSGACSVTFRITAPCNAGESIHLVGSGPLGDWQLGQSMQLSTHADCFPLWFTPKPVHVPFGSCLEYKYAIVGADGALKRWESISCNRLVSVSTALREMMVEDVLDVAPPPAVIPAPSTPAVAAAAAHQHHGPSPLSATSTTQSAMNAHGPQLHVHANADHDHAVHSHSHGYHAVPIVTSHAAAPAVAGSLPPGASVSTGARSAEQGQGGDNEPVVAAPLAAGSDSERDGLGGATGIGGGGVGDAFARESLGDSDGVLIVQYALPVRLTRLVDPVTGAPIRGAFACEWDEEALLSPKLQMAAEAVSASVAPKLQEAVAASPASSAAGSGGGAASSGVATAEAVGHRLLLRQGSGLRSSAASASLGAAAAVAAAAATAAAAGLSQARVRWIGTPPLPPGSIDVSEEEALTRVLEPFRCVPVFLPAAVHSSYYDGYCCDTLWPIFHNVIDVYGDLPTRWWLTARQKERWKAYMDANQRFAAAVVECFHEGDMVWIHDYPLLLVPMLLARRHIAPVGLFLHIPFPSSEIFRSLSMRDELLRGMLHADHVAFHLFEYARHFLTSCRRILGLTHTPKRGGMLAVDCAGREVTVTVSHVGVEPEFLRAQFVRHPAVVRTAAGWRARFPGCSIVAGIDSIERLRGVPLKLFAWEAFLRTHPEMAGRAVLVQYCLADTVRPGDTQERSVQEIVALAHRINAAYSRPRRRSYELQPQTPDEEAATALVPAVYLVFRSNGSGGGGGAVGGASQLRPVGVQERAALWAAADVMLNTAIRDGLNLLPFEYVYCRGEGDCAEAGIAAMEKSESGSRRGGSDGGGGGVLLRPIDVSAGHLRPDDSFAAVRGWLQGPLVVDAPEEEPEPASPAPGPAGSGADAAAVRAQLDDLALKPGVLILSEFSGCSRVLSGAIRVNPWRVEDVVSALHHALSTMSAPEAAARHAGSWQYVTGNTTSSWAERVLVDLKTVSRRAGTRTYMGYGLGLGYRLMGFGATFKPLNAEHVVMAFRRATRRLVVCDYGGTLRTRELLDTRRHAFELGMLGKDTASPLTADTKRALRLLSEDTRNTVFVISGKEKDVLREAFAGLPHVGLAAEHGFTLRWGAPRTQANPHPLPSPNATATAAVVGTAARPPRPPQPAAAATPTAASFAPAASAPSSAALAAVNDNGMPWQALVHEDLAVTRDWKALCAGVMDSYTARTNGTYTLRKGSALSWFYGDADPEFGSLQAKELTDHLTGVLAAFPVDVMGGVNYVEVRPRGVNKGAVLCRIVDVLEGRDIETHALPPPHLARRYRREAARRQQQTAPASGAVGSTPSAAATAPGSPQAAATLPLPASVSTASLASVAASAAAGGVTPSSTATPTASGDGAAPGEDDDEGAAGGRFLIPPGRNPAEWLPGPLEFILVIGDDAADEEMFLTAQAYRKERPNEHRAAVVARVSASHAEAIGLLTSPPNGGPSDPAASSQQPAGSQLGVTVSPVPSLQPTQQLLPQQQPHLNYHEFTVTVGRKPSAAQYFLDDTQQVEDLMRALAKATATAGARVAAGSAVGGSKSTAGSASGSGSGGSAASIAAASAALGAAAASAASGVSSVSAALQPVYGRAPTFSGPSSLPPQHHASVSSAPSPMHKQHPAAGAGGASALQRVALHSAMQRQAALASGGGQHLHHHRGHGGATMMSMPAGMDRLGASSRLAAGGRWLPPASAAVPSSAAVGGIFAASAPVPVSNAADIAALLRGGNSGVAASAWPTPGAASPPLASSSTAAVQRSPDVAAAVADGVGPSMGPGSSSALASVRFASGVTLGLPQAMVGLYASASSSTRLASYGAGLAALASVPEARLTTAASSPSSARGTGDGHDGSTATSSARAHRGGIGQQHASSAEALAREAGSGSGGPISDLLMRPGTGGSSGTAGEEGGDEGAGDDGSDRDSQSETEEEEEEEGGVPHGRASPLSPLRSPGARASSSPLQQQLASARAVAGTSPLQSSMARAGSGGSASALRAGGSFSFGGGGGGTGSSHALAGLGLGAVVMAQALAAVDAAGGDSLNSYLAAVAEADAPPEF